MDLTATQAAFALVAIVGAETLALAGRQAGRLSKVGPWRGAALPAVACWLGLALGALLGLLCYPDYPESGPPEKVGVLFVTPGLVLGGAALLALVRRARPEPPAAADGWRVARERDLLRSSVATAVLCAVVGLPLTYRLTTSSAQRALPWSAREVHDEHRFGLGLDLSGTLTARVPEAAAREVAARLGLREARDGAGTLAWEEGRRLATWEAGRLSVFGPPDGSGLTATLASLLLVGLVGAFGFGCCAALAVDQPAKPRAFALGAGACWLGLGLGRLVQALALQGPPEAVGVLLSLPGVLAGAAAALVVIRRDVTHARPGALHAHPRAALWGLGAGTAAAPLALLVVLLSFTEAPQRALPWSAREVRDSCSWEPLSPTTATRSRRASRRRPSWSTWPGSASSPGRRAGRARASAVRGRCRPGRCGWSSGARSAARPPGSTGGSFSLPSGPDGPHARQLRGRRDPCLGDRGGEAPAARTWTTFRSAAS